MERISTHSTPLLYIYIYIYTIYIYIYSAHVVFLRSCLARAHTRNQTEGSDSKVSRPPRAERDSLLPDKALSGGAREQGEEGARGDLNAVHERSFAERHSRTLVQEQANILLPHASRIFAAREPFANRLSRMQMTRPRPVVEQRMSPNIYIYIYIYIYIIIIMYIYIERERFIYIYIYT